MQRRDGTTVIPALRQRYGPGSQPKLPSSMSRAVVATPARRVLFAGLYSGMTAGCFYGFGIYSPALKKHFALSQQQLMNINTIPYAFGVFSFFWGMVTKKMGPTFSMWVGGTLLTTSQVFMYSLGTSWVELPAYLPPPITLVATNCVTYWGMQLVSSAAFTAPILHFPQYRGDVASIVKSFVGVSGSVTTTLFVLIWGTPKGDQTALNALLLWASISAVMNFAAGACVPRSYDAASARSEPRRMLTALFWTLAMLGVLGLFSHGHAGSLVHNVVISLLIILSIAPVLVIFSGLTGDSDVYATVDHDPHTCPATMSPATAAPKKPAAMFESPQQYSCTEVLGTLDAWLFVFVGVVVVGSGTFFATNCAQIISSSGASTELVPTTITLFSSGNLLGRLLCNIPSDTMVRHGWPRPLFLVALAAGAAVAQVALLFAARLPAESEEQSMLLQFGAGLCGLAFGAIWPHFVVLSSELFGSTHLSSNYMFFDGTAGAIGTLLLANALPSLIYQAASKGSLDCEGPFCFGPTHAIIAGLCTAAAGAAGAMAVRSVALYRQISAAQRQSAQELL